MYQFKGINRQNQRVCVRVFIFFFLGGLLFAQKRNLLFLGAKYHAYKRCISTHYVDHLSKLMIIKSYYLLFLQ